MGRKESNQTNKIFIAYRRNNFPVTVLLWGIGTWTVSPRLLKKIENMNSFILVVRFAMDGFLTFLVAHILLLHFLVGW